jgi:hypothetical protein
MNFFPILIIVFFTFIVLFISIHMVKEKSVKSFLKASVLSFFVFYIGIDVKTVDITSCNATSSKWTEAKFSEYHVGNIIINIFETIADSDDSVAEIQYNNMRRAKLENSSKWSESASSLYSAQTRNKIQINANKNIKLGIKTTINKHGFYETVFPPVNDIFSKKEFFDKYETYNENINFLNYKSGRFESTDESYFSRCVEGLQKEKKPTLIYFFNSEVMVYF